MTERGAPDPTLAVLLRLVAEMIKLPGCVVRRDAFEGIGLARLTSCSISGIVGRESGSFAQHLYNTAQRGSSSDISGNFLGSGIVPLIFAVTIFTVFFPIS